ncbi:hypothetical protein SLEP1_g9437 [Rubroshorea leprosula]|uniref:RNase H type-1 domain-containing protein n=1 Tax=Rubroshorea leprosula TaxID=152421 RepID=A0AAV5IAV2_9ROSI|nr:hypothetical protein SLEP1_g9437 [Rubroshorea leprosula]
MYLIGTWRTCLEFQLSCNAQAKHQPLEEARNLEKTHIQKGELQAIKEEVHKLLQTRFVRRVDYCEWVANSILVKKSNGKWWMCIAYTNLNDTCPKDYYPMPSIDKLVEAASGNERLSLLDAYSGYHQVHMAPEDEIGRNLEVYVDDTVVKSLNVEDHLTDLVETFDNLRKHNMRLNPTKFISKPVDKCLPFFKILRSTAHKGEARKPKKFEWTFECQVAFNELKTYLSSPPLLTKAEEGEILYLSLGIFDTTISSILVREVGKQQKPVYYGKVLQGAEQRYEHTPKFNFKATNNMAEYEALLLGLRLATELKVRSLQVYNDSQLMVNQVNSTCEVTDPTFVKYIVVVFELRCHFERFQLTKVSRVENEHADSLSKLASDSSGGVRYVYVEILNEPSFQMSKVMEISSDPKTPN